MASTITTFSHLKIPLEDVLKATNNFDAKNVIGHGGLGKVYKGKLLRSGKWMNIAARRLDTKHKQDIEFWTEISALSTLKHENLVSIIGFCDEKGEKVIINNHEANRSLSMYLSNPCLTWIQRLRICVGVARALSYTHYEDGRKYSVIHRNINSSTILLDDNFEPKLSGFEYSINHSVHRMDQVLFSEAIGTTGYMDPSIEKSGGVTHKSDIYSFGVVLCEVLCGRKAFIPNEDNSFLAPLAMYHFENQTINNIIQPGLHYQMGDKSFQKFSKIAYSCLNDERVRRPDMKYVVHELEEALELQLPYESLFTNNLEQLKFPLGDLKIRLADIKLATDNFSEAYRMWDTSFYDVYRAELELFDKENCASVEQKSKSELPKRLATVVIKRLRPREDKRGEKVFFTEIEILTSCKHDNIVSLLGFCDEGFEKILVIEHLSNGYLDDYLLNIKDEPIPTWAERLKICLDVAYGLNYLHYEMEDKKTVINRNIKSGIIALDENWRAKIADFGYSLFLPLNQDDDDLHLIVTAGTPGYKDPEYYQTCKLKRESDVYSFGVVLFEVLCGTVAYDPIYMKESEKGLAFVVQRRFHEGTLKEMIDPLIKEESNDNNFILTKGPNKDSLDIFVKIAYQCLTETQDQRPTMEVVIKELKKALSFQEQVQHQDIDQVVEKSLELKMTHENHGNILEHLKIRLRDIMLATDNFSEAYRMWDTLFYDLYRAELEHFDKENFAAVTEKSKSELSKRRTTVVIKCLLPREDKGGEKAFFSEIEILTSCKHHNIVGLLGFCDEGFEKILVIEHLSNGYLDNYLFSVKDKHVLTWAERLKICLDVAYGLNYLHYEMEDKKTVINCNIKSGIIALDENWRAKIADFGHSVFLPPNLYDDSLHVKWVNGTDYYIDPEYENTHKLKRESDVYSFGVVLFEILTGRLAIDPIYTKESDKGLAYVARRCFHDGTVKDMIDPIIKDECSVHNLILSKGPNKDSLNIFVNIAYQCLAERQYQRPTMKAIIKELEKALLFQEQAQRQDNQVVYGFEKSLQLKMTNKNLEESENAVESRLWNNRKGNILEHLRIRLSDIMLATDNFSKAYCTGETSFYDLYTAELEHFDNENCAFVEGSNECELPKRRTTVKRIRPTEDKRGEKVFFTEIEILTSCKHHNIVRLLGFCDEGFEKILVVEHLSNGPLHGYLFDIKDKPILTWAERLKICLDVAHGLNYLHYEMEDQKAVIHSNMKSAKIELDKNWGAKIVDFGYSMFLPPNQDEDALYPDKISRISSYRDPEYDRTGRLKRESDVYSFGVILLEILCGRLAYDPMYRKESIKGLAYLAQRWFHDGTIKEMIDPIIMEESGENTFTLNRGPNKNSLDVFLKIAFECLEETQDQRPTMKVVVKELEKALFFHENNKDGDLRISVEDIKLATQNFHDDNCIGGGGFGKVYKGKIPEGAGFNTIVAKRLDTRGGQGEIQFRSELQILFEYKHDNIISLVGYCDEKDAKIIVYEYASRGSLDRYLNDTRLTWMKRLNICIDVATALDFLHKGVGTQATVIHRDIKTANILLNDDWDAKLADFGLSLISAIHEETDYVIDHACGTPGYVDPLFLNSGFLTKESDIYSFGVVLFEILCGRPTFVIHKQEGVYLPSFIKHSFEKGKQDEVVFEEIKAQIIPEALSAFQTIAYQCLNENREERPKAKEVVEQLKMALEFQMSRSAGVST